MFTTEKTIAVAMLAAAAVAFPSPDGVSFAEKRAVQAYHTKGGPMPVQKDTVKPQEDDVSQVCFLLDGYSQDWYYACAGGPWGDCSGQFKDLPYGNLCVPTNSTTGGAVYLSELANPGPGDTKLECFFPPSGNAYCDISLVDGYSVSVTCNAAGITWGGSGDFFTQGNACPDSQGANCINTEGYAASQSDVAPFFQYGVQDGNSYCIWQDCAIPGVFDISNHMDCHVTAGGY